MVARDGAVSRSACLYSRSASANSNTLTRTVINNAVSIRRKASPARMSRLRDLMAFSRHSLGVGPRLLKQAGALGVVEFIVVSLGRVRR